MAPKKNENKTPKIPKEKIKKAKIKKDSPKSKKQIIRVKLPLKSTKSDAKKKSIVDDAKKMLTFDRMNEVALAQLVKECPVQIEAPPPPVPKKRGRKKKIQCPEPDAVPKKILKGPPKVQKKVIKKQAAAPKTSLIKKGRGRPPLRGKLKQDDDSTITSPSILSQGLPELKTPLKLPQKLVLQSPADPGQNPDSRRTSVASEWSWTKDMSLSGSSTTTCLTVSSFTCTDFVRIDGKLPELKLTKISIPEPTAKNKMEAEKKEGEHSLSEESSSCDCSSLSSSSSDSTSIRSGLNLSTSSVSPVPHSPTYTAMEQSFDRRNKQDIDEVSFTIEMLAPKLKSFDMKFPDLGNESEYILDMKPFEEKVFKIFEDEYNAILECNFLDQLLSEKCEISETKAPEVKQKDDAPQEPEFVKPDISMICNKSVCDNRDSNNDYSFDCSRQRDPDESYDPNAHEDDDVLSILAESLTGMESTRISSSASVACAPPIHEEYVPKLLGEKPPAAASYQPTKINEVETANTKSKPICEKQNADSTSIHKEQELPPPKPLLVNNTHPGAKVNGNNVMYNQPPLTLSYYKSGYGEKSATLRDVCFFNLTSKCKKTVCRYPHCVIDDAELSKRLSQLAEEQFIQEYMVIAKWPVLRRKYVKCFVNECQRRELPKILVEIVIHFLSNYNSANTEDSAIKVDIIESTLLYLNMWDLEVCEPLLMYKIGGQYLCDVFMGMIGHTQNFSRFKHVFINLAAFMVRVKRTFHLDVVAHVLERVCILPFEAPLAAVLVDMMEKTDCAIFDNKMMQIFEMQLSNCNKGLHERFVAIKQKSVRQPVSLSEKCPSALPSPCGSKELEPLAIAQNGGQDEQRYTSPDTTNMDNVNKPASDPVFIRTINHPVKPPDFSVPPPSYQGSKFSNWHQRNLMQQFPRMPPIRPRKRPMRGRPLERPQFKFQRRFGPEFYNNH